MRNSTKFISLILALVIAFSLASCTLGKAYSYKVEEDNTELPIGVYIYQMYAAYQQAQGFAQKSDKYDSEKQTYDGQKSFLKMEITDDDDVTATADEWIKDTADKNMKKILAIYHEFKRLGATIDQATEESNQASCKEYWDNGPYYQTYGEQYKNPYSDIFEPLGVSYDSFYLATFYQQAMSDKVFEGLYSATSGEQAVTDEELTKYFKENYTNYKYFSANLYTTEEAPATDNETGTETSNTVDVAFSEEKVKEYNDAFNGYVDSLNEGAKFEDVVAQYMSDFGVKEDPTVKNCEIMEDSQIGDELVVAIDALEQGQASSLTVGEGNTAVLYLVYKDNIDDAVEENIGDQTKRDTILHKYKDEPYEDYLKGVADTLNISISSECGKYTPSKIESLATPKGSKK